MENYELFIEERRANVDEIVECGRFFFCSFHHKVLFPRKKRDTRMKKGL